MKRNASATWNGGLKDGQGRFSVGSGVIKDMKFGFRTRFEDEPGTNPEELIAAAHASCFSMALSAQLELSALRLTEAMTKRGTSVLLIVRLPP